MCISLVYLTGSFVSFQLEATGGAGLDTVKLAFIFSSVRLSYRPVC